MSIQKLNTLTHQDSQIPFPPSPLHLGPSGFRDLSEKIPKAAYRVGVYVGKAITSSTHPQYYVIMITASHNPKEYNGIKVSNGEGQSLGNEQSHVIEQFVNDKNEDWNSDIDLELSGHPESRVFLGMDKRDTSPHLYKQQRQALSNFKVTVLHYYNVTTPTLYSYCYSYIHQTNGVQKGSSAKEISECYLKSSIETFKAAAEIVKWDDKPNVTLDCANGAVGVEIKSYLPLLEEYFDVNVINTDKFQDPNFECGSDYVSTMKLLPLGIVALTSEKFVSFDGDGDRIVVYFKKSQEQPLLLFDGDRLNSILITALTSLLKSLNLRHNLNLKVGCITTIVSNRGFLEFLETLNVNTRVCKVGIKYLFQEVGQFDIGSLFESSGHGSLFVNHQVYLKLMRIEEKTPELRLLLCLLDLCNNNSRGDGFKCFLVLQLCQKYLNLSNSELSLYKQYQFISSSLELTHLDKLKLDPVSGEVLEPEGVVTLFKEIREKHPEIFIVMRKSNTQKNIIRIKLQSKEAGEQSLRTLLDLIKSQLSLQLTFAI